MPAAPAAALQVAELGDRLPIGAGGLMLTEQRPWLVPALAAATALVIGVALSAAIFSGDDPPAPAAVAAPAAADCAPTQVTVPPPVIVTAAVAAPAAPVSRATPDVARPTAPAAVRRPPATRVTLGIVSNPRGAIVMIGGKTVGKAPLTTEVPTGKNRIKFVLAGYRPHEQTVVATSGRPVRVLAKLVKDAAVKATPKPGR